MEDMGIAVGIVQLRCIRADRVRIVKNELGGSATQQELKGWGLGVQWNEQGNWGVKPQPLVNSNPTGWYVSISGL